VITLRSDGVVGFEPARELQSLRDAHHRWDAVRLTPSSEYALPEIQSDCLEIDAEIAPGDAAVCGVDVRRSPDGAEYTRIAYDRERRRLEIDRRHSSASAEDLHDVQGGDMELPDGEPLRLQIFVDRSVVEVFANGRVCATSRVYPSRADSLGIALFAEGGAAEARSIDIWEVGTMWTN
jgi:sucrose-6-phosphate hydrolase SacC (GH32 family)